MSWMFIKSKFNQDISNWNVGNVWTMQSMFGYSNFNQDISNWNVGNVTFMHKMFYESKFNKDISNWDISNVIDMSSMFVNSKFNQNISKWLIKLNKKCNLHNFMKNKDFEINSYTDFKKYHRQIVLNNLNNY